MEKIKAKAKEFEKIFLGSFSSFSPPLFSPLLSLPFFLSLSFPLSLFLPLSPFSPLLPLSSRMLSQLQFFTLLLLVSPSFLYSYSYSYSFLRNSYRIQSNHLHNDNHQMLRLHDKRIFKILSSTIISNTKVSSTKSSISLSPSLSPSQSPSQHCTTFALNGIVCLCCALYESR